MTNGRVLALLLALALSAVPACGDDDGGSSNQSNLNDQNNNNQAQPFCGDGVKNGADGVESCDGDDLGFHTCANQGFPGGGVIACTAVCTLDTTACIPGPCGDGIVDAGEECDDGTANSDTAPDACRTDCRAAGCGDGVADFGEICDDGGVVLADGCSETCAVEEGWVCSDEPSACSPVCGDGLIVGDEACDDSDTQSGDGCSATCMVEAGWECTGEPSVCTTD